MMLGSGSYLEAKGTGAIATTWVDRPFMAIVWSLLATNE